MKKFNLAKGIITALLAVALVLGCGQAFKAKADTNKVTFKTTIDNVDYTWEKDITYKAAVTAAWLKKSDGTVVNGITVTSDGSAAYTPNNGTSITVKYVAAVEEDAEAGTQAAPAYWFIVGMPNSRVTMPNDWSGTDDVELKYRAASGEVTQSINLSEVLEKLGKEVDALLIKPTDATITYKNAEGAELTGNDAPATFANNAFAITSEDSFTVIIGTAIPKVTFTVTVEDMFHESNEEGYAGGTYEYVAGTEFQKANKTLPLATILAEMKKVVDGEVTDTTLDDSTAWIVSAQVSAVNEVNAFTVSDKNFKLSSNLAADRNVSFTVTNSKIPITFSYTDSASAVYKAVFYVDNKAYAANAYSEIAFADIVSNLKKTVDGNEEGFEGEKIILHDAFASANSSASATTKYSTWKYKYRTDSILTTKPNAVTIATNKIEDTFVNDSQNDIYTGYDPATDSIKFVSKYIITINWADVKKSAGATLTSKSFKSVDTKKQKTTDTYYTAFISLSDKSSGVNNAVTKATYIYASTSTPAEGKTKYSANYIVDATPYKKIEVTLDYAGVKKDDTTAGVARFNTINNSKKTVAYIRGTDPASEDAPEDFTNVWNSLQYSTDGTTWRKITGNDLVNNKSVDLTTGMLYTLVSGSKTTLYFRVSGARAIAADEATETAAKNAYRPCKTVKVSVTPAKAGKAVKLDATKNTVALKNGYDFALGDNEKGFTNLGCTILPFNKDGKAVDEDGNAVFIVLTSNYSPVKKVTDDAEMFTTKKVKSLTIEEICDCFSGKNATDSKLYLYVRKSATAAKPADQWALITIMGKTAAPSLTATKGYFAIGDDNGTLVIPAAKKASADKTSASGFEFLIIDEADAENISESIDFSTAKWTKLEEGKTIVVGKTKSKYGKPGAKASDHVLKDGSRILVRRVGDTSSYTLASDYVITKVVKSTVQVEVEKDGKKEKVDKDLFTWVAN